MLAILIIMYNLFLETWLGMPTFNENTKITLKFDS